MPASQAQDYRRFAELQVIASLRLSHHRRRRWTEGRIGKERCASSYANARCSTPAPSWPLLRLASGAIEPILGIDRCYAHADATP